MPAPKFPAIKRMRTDAEAAATKPGKIVCLDGLGAIWKSNTELEDALRPFVPDFEVAFNHTVHCTVLTEK